MLHLLDKRKINHCYRTTFPKSQCVTSRKFQVTDTFRVLTASASERFHCKFCTIWSYTLLCNYVTCCFMFFKKPVCMSFVNFSCCAWQLKRFDSKFFHVILIAFLKDEYAVLLSSLVLSYIS